GIAIAMKDMFMSLLGWTVIVFGGSIHVGDRIKVKRNGLTYVGDVIDISLLRITILEDVTLTSYLENRRAGRVIFIPNNYIFTDLIANYTHQGFKTVWDTLVFNITFDSNHKKAAYIAKEVARKYAKGYTDIARKQLNKLRSTYHLKNTNVDVRVFTFAEDYGFRVSLWYMTNAYATLTLRSTISAEIIDRYIAEPDIKITYPAQKVVLTTEDINNHQGEEVT
ncbi:MAG: mechanosensitive ion channel, partial [Epsilonproteobacteria bacterium]|nr:mechanosensitive ion channel [Campylobacterota bacterium]